MPLRNDTIIHWVVKASCTPSVHEGKVRAPLYFQRTISQCLEYRLHAWSRLIKSIQWNTMEILAYQLIKFVGCLMLICNLPKTTANLTCTHQWQIISELIILSVILCCPLSSTQHRMFTSLIFFIRNSLICPWLLMGYLADYVAHVWWGWDNSSLYINHNILETDQQTLNLCVFGKTHKIISWYCNNVTSCCIPNLVNPIILCRKEQYKCVCILTQMSFYRIESG